MASKILRASSRPVAHEQVSVRLAPHEIQSIDGLVSAGFFLNRSDFVRTTIREKLEGMRIETVRDVSRDRAEKEILEFLDEHPVTYPSDISTALGLDLGLVMEIVQDLLKARKVEEVPRGHA